MIGCLHDFVSRDWRDYRSGAICLHDFDRFKYDGVGFQVLKFLRTKKIFRFGNLVYWGNEKMIS